jgi:hypothetical protein
MTETEQQRRHLENKILVFKGRVEREGKILRSLEDKGSPWMTPGNLKKSVESLKKRQYKNKAKLACLRELLKDFKLISSYY